MTATTGTERTGSDAAATTVLPALFMRQMKCLVEESAWPDVVALYDRYAPTVVDRLSHQQLLRLEEIMHVADTVVEVEPASGVVRAEYAAGAS